MEAAVPGRVALVTGAGSGLGRAIGVALGAAGWRVALAGRTQARLEESARAVREAGGDAWVTPADVTDEAAIASLVARLDSLHGRLDAVVHSAGSGRFVPLEETTAADWERTLAVNLTAVFLLTRAALPLLLRAPRPLVVAMSSVAGRQAYANSSAYCASKHGLEGLLGVMRAELRTRNVRVLSVVAGATATPFWDAQPGEWDRSRMMAPEDVASLVVAAMNAPAAAAVEELLVRPSRGDL